MKEIPNMDETTKNYYDDKGYIYSKNSASKDALYLRCKNYIGKDCACRAIVRNNNFENVRIIVDHNHRPDKKAVDRLLFSKTLEKICMENPYMKPILCYVKAKNELKNQVNRKYIHESYKYSVFIHRAQRRIVPLKPKSIEEFEKLIGVAKNSNLYAYDDVDKPFYRGIWEGTSGRNVAFVSERTLNEVKDLKEVTLLMDGTFKAVPRHMNFRQLYIINVIIRNRCYPLAYILMEKKDFNSYKVVLSELKRMIPAINVINCMTDYEAATRKAIKQVFPTSRISGCFFHYVQAIQKASKRFGLRNKLYDGDFQKFINRTSALALLPNEFVVEGFKLICKSVNKSARWDRFASYWHRQWAKANISVYGLRHRTNNFSETLNRVINLMIGRKAPNIWLLIENLQTVEMVKSDELEQVLDGLIIDTQVKKETTRMNKKIKRSIKSFNKTNDVETFLDNVTFNDDLADFFVHDFKEADYIDDFDEEIIPNMYNDECDFRKKHPRAAAKKRKRT